MGQKDDPKLFDRQKLSVLDSSDLSRKGNVDKDIRNFLEKLNSHQNYFSLSSCSGRIIILRQQTQCKVIIYLCHLLTILWIFVYQRYFNNRLWVRHRKPYYQFDICYQETQGYNFSVVLKIQHFQKLNWSI